MRLHTHHQKTSMLPYLPRIFLLALSLMLPSLATAKGPTWKVSSGENTLYLGGSIHLLSQSDYPLPASLDKAYSKAETVVFETDIKKISQPSFQQETLHYLTYPDGITLDQVLDKNTYARLEKHLQSRGVALAQLNHLKPGMLAMTITLLELQRWGLAGTGVDEHYSKRAEANNIPQAQLETALSQVQKIASMGEGQESDFIRHTLQELESLPVVMQNLKNAWRSGDSQQLNALILEPLRAEFPLIYQSLIVDRNIAWLPQFIKMLHSTEVELVLVGAAHLVGEDGLLVQLEELGYTVEPM